MMDVYSPSVASDSSISIGALVLDDSGIVVGCSRTAARILARSVSSIEGAEISSLIADITPSDASPGCKARFLALMSGKRKWRRCNAIDAGGHSIALEIRLSKISLNGRDTGFLMNLRPFRARDPSSGAGNGR
jgi:PAS domain-containing protein